MGCLKALKALHANPLISLELQLCFAICKAISAVYTIRKLRILQIKNNSKCKFGRISMQKTNIFVVLEGGTQIE